MRFPLLLIALTSLALFACANDKPGVPTMTTRDPCIGSGTTVLCLNGVAIGCEDDAKISENRCSTIEQTCFDGVGCRKCMPFGVTCTDNQIFTCSMDGLTQTAGTQCDSSAGEFCSPEGCRNLCAEAESGNAYIGCEYWPVTLPNTRLADGFEFVVVVANPQLVTANVVVEIAGEPWLQVSVDAGSARSIELPWVPEIFRAGAGNGGSVIAQKSAYRVTSNVPVVAYQFNPFEYRSGDQFSYTNDASLLLPAHALTEHYMGVARTTLRVSQDATGGTNEIISPGFLAIAAIREGETSVHLRFNSHVRAIADTEYGPYAPGDEADIPLSQGDVLVLISATHTECLGGMFQEVDGTVRYCDGGPTYDLTGTEINGSQPVAVFGGHDCTFVPYHRWACDHLEEQIFPLEAWDDEALLSVSQKIGSEPNILRVISATDGNVVSFSPAITSPVTLDRGEYFEATVDNDVLVNATSPVLVAQFLVGQDYNGRGTSTSSVGDPSFALVPPSGQLRSDYVFLAPDTYDDNYANVTVPTGADVRIDGRPITNWQTSATSNYVSARVHVSGGNVHRIVGSVPFALQVYGYARYTSYLYTGGLDLAPISPPIL